MTPPHHHEASILRLQPRPTDVPTTTAPTWPTLISAPTPTPPAAPSPAQTLDADPRPRRMRPTTACLLAAGIPLGPTNSRPATT